MTIEAEPSFSADPGADRRAKLEAWRKQKEEEKASKAAAGGGSRRDSLAGGRRDSLTAGSRRDSFAKRAGIPAEAGNRRESLKRSAPLDKNSNKAVAEKKAKVSEPAKPASENAAPNGRSTRSTSAPAAACTAPLQVGGARAAARRSAFSSVASKAASSSSSSSSSSSGPLRASRPLAPTKAAPKAAAAAAAATKVAKSVEEKAKDSEPREEDEEEDEVEEADGVVVEENGDAATDEAEDEGQMEEKEKQEEEEESKEAEAGEAMVDEEEPDAVPALQADGDAGDALDLAPAASDEASEDAGEAAEASEVDDGDDVAALHDGPGQMSPVREDEEEQEQDEEEEEGGGMDFGMYLMPVNESVDSPCTPTLDDTAHSPPQSSSRAGNIFASSSTSAFNAAANATPRRLVTAVDIFTPDKPPPSASRRPISSAKRPPMGSARRMPISASPLKGGAVRVPVAASPAASKAHHSSTSGAQLPSYMSPLHKQQPPSPFSHRARPSPAPFESVASCDPSPASSLVRRPSSSAANQKSDSVGEREGRETPAISGEIVDFIEELLSPRSAAAAAAGAVSASVGSAGGLINAAASSKTPSAAKTPKDKGSSSRRKSGFMPFKLTGSGLTPARSGVDTNDEEMPSSPPPAPAASLSPRASSPVEDPKWTFTPKRSNGVPPGGSTTARTPGSGIHRTNLGGTPLRVVSAAAPRAASVHHDDDNDGAAAAASEVASIIAGGIRDAHNQQNSRDLSPVPDDFADREDVPISRPVTPGRDAVNRRSCTPGSRRTQLTGTPIRVSGYNAGGRDEPGREDEQGETGSVIVRAAVKAPSSLKKEFDVTRVLTPVRRSARKMEPWDVDHATSIRDDLIATNYAYTPNKALQETTNSNDDDNEGETARPRSSCKRKSASKSCTKVMEEDEMASSPNAEKSADLSIEDECPRPCVLSFPQEVTTAAAVSAREEGTPLRRSTRSRTPAKSSAKKPALCEAQEEAQEEEEEDPIAKRRRILRAKMAMASPLRPPV